MKSDSLIIPFTPSIRSIASITADLYMASYDISSHLAVNCLLSSLKKAWIKKITL